MNILVTGATGFLGNHIVGKLLDRGGDEVRALVREGSDAARLERQGARVARGDLLDPEALARGLRGVKGVFHVAAKVGDWGPREEFERVNADGTRTLLEAAARAGVERFVHVSSVAVYGVRCAPRILNLDPFTERAPLAQNLLPDDHYSRTKIEAERLALDYHRRGALSVRVIRPAWIYGPGDRTSLPRLVKFLRKHSGLLIGKGDNRLSLTYAPNVADAALLAMDQDAAAGECFNVSNDGEITQAEYLNKIGGLLGLKPVCQSVPYGVAYGGAALLERAARLMRRETPPTITRYGVSLIGNDIVFSHAKATKVLGWSPKVGYDEGINAALDWYFCEETGCCAG
ncbi:MAG: NAD-dependent epimerase/dehydratase family protein [Myxococcales bacterium]|nr:NAD-dependent epimerase/dehydratase family protein [Myxococcales bacterium]